MNLREFYSKVGGDYEEVCGRLGGPEIVCPIVKMLLTDRSYEKCRQALEAGDADGAFSAVHTLKGICMNLDIRSLGADAANLADVLREGQRDMEHVPAAVCALERSYLETIEAVKALA